jgi:hypothetical protein
MRAPWPGGFRVALAGCVHWGPGRVRVLNAADRVDDVVLADSRRDVLVNRRQTAPGRR